MKTLLVTGGAGFIGSNFVRMVLKSHSDWRIINLDALTYAGNPENLGEYLKHDNHVFIRGNICDASHVRDIFKKYGIDAVVNFAAESHVDRSIIDPSIFIETNIHGTRVLLEAAIDNEVEHFVQISTDEVYGELGETGTFTEETPLKPNSPYSASKAAADMLVEAFAHTYGLKYNIARCSNNYGPYQFPEKLIPLMINNAVNNIELPVYGDGLYVRDWIHVSDNCKAVWKVLTEGKNGEVYNIGSNNEKTNIEVVRAILRKLNKSESLIRYIKDRPGHDRRYATDATKIRNELGWRPSVDFESGLDETIDWYLTHSDWLKHVASGEYRECYERIYKNC